MLNGTVGRAQIHRLLQAYTHLSTAHTYVSTAHTHLSTAHTHLSAAHTHFSTAHTHLSTAHTHLSTAHTHLGTAHIRTSAQYIRTSAQHIRTSAQHIRTSAQHIRTSAQYIRTSAQHIRTSAQHIRTSEQHIRTSAQPTPKLTIPIQAYRRLASLPPPYWVAVPDHGTPFNSTSFKLGFASGLASTFNTLTRKKQYRTSLFKILYTVKCTEDIAEKELGLVACCVDMCVIPMRGPPLSPWQESEPNNKRRNKIKYFPHYLLAM